MWTHTPQEMCPSNNSIIPPALWQILYVLSRANFLPKGTAEAEKTAQMLTFLHNAYNTFPSKFPRHFSDNNIQCEGCMDATSVCEHKRVFLAELDVFAKSLLGIHLSTKGWGPCQRCTSSQNLCDCKMEMVHRVFNDTA